MQDVEVFGIRCFAGVQSFRPNSGNLISVKSRGRPGEKLVKKIWAMRLLASGKFAEGLGVLSFWKGTTETRN